MRDRQSAFDQFAAVATVVTIPSIVLAVLVVTDRLSWEHAWTLAVVVGVAIPIVHLKYRRWGETDV